ncbi:hypothetical protein ACJA25_00090 [Mycoplasmopsis hyopharyngis]|uniref:hypothetical protein n=1 Tax=Mycoplasmopsis hyopharyngis TaxID=29558 RepID=UPI003873826A
MIYCTCKTLNVKPEMKDEFNKWIYAFINEIKKESMNLSYDGGWKSDSTFVILERWSSEMACKTYYAKKDNKEKYVKINSFVVEPIKYFGYTTIN